MAERLGIDTTFISCGTTQRRNCSAREWICAPWPVVSAIAGEARPPCASTPHGSAASDRKAAELLGSRMPKRRRNGGKDILAG